MPTWDPGPPIRQVLTLSRAGVADTASRGALHPVRFTGKNGGWVGKFTPRYVTRGAIRNRREREAEGHFASNKGRLNAVSQLRCPQKEREEWFSLEGHEKACRIIVCNRSRNRRGHLCKQPAGGIDRFRTMRRCVGQHRARGFPFWRCWYAHLPRGRRPSRRCRR